MTVNADPIILIGKQRKEKEVNSIGLVSSMGRIDRVSTKGYSVPK